VQSEIFKTKTKTELLDQIETGTLSFLDQDQNQDFQKWVSRPRLSQSLENFKPVYL